MPNGSGSNGVGAGADATAQRKRGAQSDVFGAPRGRIYPLCPGAAQRGVSVRFVPRAGTGRSLRQTIRSPCRIRCPLPVSDPVGVVRSAAWGEGMAHRLPCSGAHIGAQNLGCVFANGGNATKTDIAMQHCREFVGLRTGCGRYALSQRVRQRLHEKACWVRLYFVS
jgi:hypothetical protein